MNWIKQKLSTYFTVLLSSNHVANIFFMTWFALSTEHWLLLSRGFYNNCIAHVKHVINLHDLQLLSLLSRTLNWLPYLCSLSFQLFPRELLLLFPRLWLSTLKLKILDIPAKVWTSIGFPDKLPFWLCIRFCFWAKFSYALFCYF